MDRNEAAARKPQTRRRSPLTRLTSLSTLRALVNRLHEGIYITSHEGVIQDANPAFLEMLGVESMAELRQLRVEDLYVNPCQRAEELDILTRDGEVLEYELRLRTPQGQVRTYLDTAYAVTDSVTGDTLYHGILVDITALTDLREQLREQATRDPLTGCFNRRFLAELAAEIDQSRDSWGAAVLDVDHFKLYNDRYGHQVGDRALVKTARFLMRHVRAEDIVCRIGGDEFLVVLPGADEALTASIVERFTAEAARSAPVSFSVGWTVRQASEPLEKTVGRADSLLISARADRRRGPPAGSPARRRAQPARLSRRRLD